MIDDSKQQIFEDMFRDFLDPLTVPIIGFGGAGGNVLEKVREKLDKDQYLQSSNVKTIHFSTKSKDSRRLNVNFQFQISSPILGEHDDTEGFVEVGEKILEETLDNLSAIKPDLLKDFKNAEAIILVAGLGGGMGTGGIIEMLTYLNHHAPWVPVFVILIKPFHFETRSIGVREYIEKILKVSHTAPIVISNQEFFKNAKKDEKFRDLLDRINEEAAEKIMGIVNRIRNERKIAFRELLGKIFDEEFEFATRELNLIAK